MRVEDLDRPRVRAGAEQRILDDLAWLGLGWDEGPDVGGPHAPYRQSERVAAYESAFLELLERRRVYPCFCSRKDILAAASAPQEPGDEIRYPGSCRDLRHEVAERRIASGDRHAWRYRVGDRPLPEFRDAVHGGGGGPRAKPPGDFVVWRSDGVPSYQLAVVVDDAAMAIDDVVRGDDLQASTIRQLLLIRALGLPIPTYAHTPLLLGPDGVRLSKRHRGTSLAEIRSAGWSPERTVGWIARVLGLSDRDEVRPVDLIDRFSWKRVRKADGTGIVIDPPL
jgi:glutamyl-tRNA synthetase